jgi:F-type H+-transporting ATPase subunit b
MLATATVASLPTYASEAAPKTGLPQLDTTFYAGELFWLLVCFASLYMLMAKIALPSVKNTQENRATVLASDMAAAEASNIETKLVMAQYEKALVDARAKAHATVTEIVAKAAREAAENDQRAQAFITKRLHEAEFSIQTARDAALTDVKQHAAQLAQVIFTKVTAAEA